MVKIPRRRAADPKPDNNSAMTAASNPPEGRLKQVLMVARIIRENDSRALPIIIGSGLGIIVVFVLVVVIAYAAQYGR